MRQFMHSHGTANASRQMCSDAPPDTVARHGLLDDIHRARVLPGRSGLQADLGQVKGLTCEQEAW